MNSFASAPEIMSALADGQLRDDELAQAWQVIVRDDDAVASWSQYHLIGDLLRLPVIASSSLYDNLDANSFVDRLNLKLRAEGVSSSSTGGSPKPLRPAAGFQTLHHAQHIASPEGAANDDVFRWKLLAGFATLAAVSVITWTAIGPVGVSLTGPQLAQSDDVKPVLVASPQGLIVRDARLNELLAAHKQLGSISALQAPSGFLQSAAFESSPGGGR